MFLLPVATATQVKNKFGEYLRIAESGEPVVITRNGREVARILGKNQAQAFLIDSLVGIAKGDVDYVRDRDKLREERLAKYLQSRSDADGE